jgi:hypothetical protein
MIRNQQTLAESSQHLSMNIKGTEPTIPRRERDCMAARLGLHG